MIVSILWHGSVSLRSPDSIRNWRAKRVSIQSVWYYLMVRFIRDLRYYLLVRFGLTTFGRETTERSEVAFISHETIGIPDSLSSIVTIMRMGFTLLFRYYLYSWFILLRRAYHTIRFTLIRRNYHSHRFTLCSRYAAIHSSIPLLSCRIDSFSLSSRKIHSHTTLLFI